MAHAKMMSIGLARQVARGRPAEPARCARSSIVRPLSEGDVWIATRRQIARVLDRRVRVVTEVSQWRGGPRGDPLARRAAEQSSPEEKRQRSPVSRHC